MEEKRMNRPISVRVVLPTLMCLMTCRIAGADIGETGTATYTP